jgi:hypothetical protein
MLKTALALIGLLAGIGTFSVQASAHGCHATGVVDRYGNHYHGRDCVRIPLPPRYYDGPSYRDRRCWRECTGVGPLRTCRTRCRGDGNY